VILGQGMLNLSLPYLQLKPDPPILEVYALGAGVLVTITLLHGGGLGHIVRSYRRGAKRLLQKASHPWRASLLFGWSILLMLTLHTIDTCIWALVLLVCLGERRQGVMQTGKNPVGSNHIKDAMPIQVGLQRKTHSCEA